MMINKITIKKRINETKLKLIDIISAELSINKVALTIALGLVYGIIPFFLGASIFLGGLTAWRLKLNHALMQLISNIIYPIQFILFVPFLRIGTELFSADTIEFSSSFILNIFKEDMLGGIKMFGMWILYGLLLWVLFSAVVAPLLFYISKSMLTKFNLVPNAAVTK